ncbi:hypothetical protein VE00_02188 [Pseudogymnoascus sp. WSF 3629]|nr:hypothetical protein VE00_02188 [Pseudogymnoascus sp. WSF 3629]
MKLFRTAANSACRPSTHHLRRNSSFRQISLSASPTRSRSSLSSVPATPWSQGSSNGGANSGNGEAAAKRTAKPPKTAYIALGSNMGDRIGMIEQACNALTSRGIAVKRTSNLWETEPMYVLDQDNFINGACEVETTLEPLELLDELQDIENSMGRHKVIDKGPRNIDLDILLYDNQVIHHKRLDVPHIGIPEREFVLRPLAELIPDKPIHPSKPWKITLDYLNALPSSSQPMSTSTPLGSNPALTLYPLRPHRQTSIMAILNLTPDSFSDGGLHTSASLDETIDTFIRGGASIIDIGGQSTAPNTPSVTADLETSRILPAIAAIRAHPLGSNVTISIDTFRAPVASAAIAAGADLINDVSAGLLDPAMLPTLGRLGCTVCLMHMRGTPSTMDSLAVYPNGLIPTIAAELLERVAAAEAAGVRRWRIILDPGIGFAKTQDQNLEILRRLDELRDWPGLRGFPWLVGSSRKRFVGRLTGVKEPRERVWGTAATVVAAVQGGADIVRVHDAVEMGQVVKMADAIWRV